MKLMIASDIHGSAYYCKLMLAQFDKEKADKLLLLGDILYHGPRNDLPKEYEPRAVISMLNPFKNKLLCVRGNCDSDVDQMVLDFPILADYALIATESCIIYATHGHNFNDTKLPPLGGCDILLSGHTHVPKCTAHENYIYMNPGSVSIPKEESHHGYMTLDGGIFVWKDLDGNILKKYSV